MFFDARSPWLRYAGWIAFGLGVAALLHFLHVQLAAILAWLIAAAGVVAIVESGLHRLHHLTISTGKMLDRPDEWSADHAESHWRATLLGLAGVSILLLFALGFAAIWHSAAPSDPSGLHASVDFPEPLRAALLHYLQNPPAPSGPGGSGSSSSNVLQLDPEVRAALLAHLQAPPEAPTPWLLWIAITVLALALAAVIILRPSKTPLAVAVTLASAAFAHVKDLNRPSVEAMETILILLVVVAALMFLGGGLLAALRWRLAPATAAGVFGSPDPAPQQAEQEKKGFWRRLTSLWKKSAPLLEDALVSSGLALLVLLWVALLIPHRVPTAPTDPLPPPPSAYSIAAPVPLDPSSFAKGDWSHPAHIQDLVDSLRGANPSPDDLLVLIGSADCTRVNPGGEVVRNQDFAARRASQTWDAITKSPDRPAVLPKVQQIALPQYESCKDTEKLRAVFPYLLRAAPKSTPSAP